MQNDDEWNIIYYKTSHDASPVEDFIDTLDIRARTKVANALDLLEEFGIKLRLPHVKKLENSNLWELRVLGQDNLRVLYVAVVGKNFLLLHGFSKKKQKTDKKDIKIALVRLRDYRIRTSDEII